MNGLELPMLQRLIAAGEGFETVWPIDFRSRISAIAASGTPAIHGVVWGIHQG